MVGDLQANPIWTKGLTNELVVFMSREEKIVRKKKSRCLNQSKACRAQGKVPEMISHAAEATVPKKLESVCDPLLKHICQLARCPDGVKSDKALESDPSAVAELVLRLEVKPRQGFVAVFAA